MGFQLHTDIKNPTALTAAARAGFAETNSVFPLSAYLPILETESETWSFNVESKKQIDSAEFLTFDSETSYGRDFGTESKIGRLLPLGKKKLVNELDLRYVTDKGTLFENHAIQLGEQVAKLFETARAGVLVNGKFTYSENGVNASVDFGRPAANKITLASADKWDASGSDPVAKIIEWVSDFPEITTYLVPKSIIAKLAQNAKVIAEFLGRGDNLPGRIGFDDVAVVFAKYGINLVDSTTPYSNLTLGGQLVDFTNPLPADTVIGVRPNGIGQTQIGLASEVSNPEFGLQNAGPGLIAYATVNHDPEGFDIVARGFGFPVLTAARYTFTAKVI